MRLGQEERRLKEHLFALYIQLPGCGQMRVGLCSWEKHRNKRKRPQAVPGEV